jgi:riboflavin kinase/FMN adenylyltransferase
MEIVFDINKTLELPECAATIGVFDGVHDGHQLIIKQMMDDARYYGYKSMVITFDRLPRELFDACFKPQLLTTLSEKKQLLSALGVDYVVVLPFTMELAQLSARDFMQQVLMLRLNVKTLRLGYDNRFGRGRAEGFEEYESYGREIDMKVYRGIPLVSMKYVKPVSSSLIRRLIAEDGNVNAAADMLTRPFCLSGTVKSGEHIGSTLGFPTANLEPDDDGKLIPAKGAYVVTADLGNGLRLPAMMNIGTRPTFEGQKQTLEVNILDFEGDLYGKRFTVYFVERLRGERRFDSPEALVAQLEEDKKRTLEIINRK